MASYSYRLFLTEPFIIYSIRNSLLYLPIRKVLLDFLQCHLFLSLTVLTINILFLVFKLFLTVSNISFTTYYISYFLESAIAPVSAIAQFYMFLFTVSVTYQYLLRLSPQYSYQVHLSAPCSLVSSPAISLVMVLATPLSYFYHHHTVSAYQVVLSASYIG